MPMGICNIVYPWNGVDPLLKSAIAFDYQHPDHYLYAVDTS